MSGSSEQNMPQFHAWFTRYKASDIIVSVLPPVRISTGFQGNPLELFTTNSSESISSVVKKEVEWKENKLPALIDHLKAICDRQIEEIHKVVIG